MKQAAPASGLHADSEARRSPAARRVAWVAGTRGEVLMLGPLLRELRRADPAEAIARHALLHTAEHGAAAWQALDWLALHPEESSELAHPAEELAVRLQGALERVEGFARQRKAERLVFCGFGTTAAAAALCCHARGCRGLWLRPADPAGLIARQRWEAGLARVIAACAPLVETCEAPMPADLRPWREAALGAANPWLPPAPDEVPGLRSGAPRVLIAVLRRNWGLADDTTDRLARAATAWAAAHPDADWVVLSNLNQRLEAPMRSQPTRPANLLICPPLPYPAWLELLAGARAVLTDSVLIAAECQARALPLATLGDNGPARPEDGDGDGNVISNDNHEAPIHWHCTPPELEAEMAAAWFSRALAAPVLAPGASASGLDAHQLASKFIEWIQS